MHLPEEQVKAADSEDTTALSLALMRAAVDDDVDARISFEIVKVLIAHGAEVRRLSEEQRAAAK